MVLKELYRYQNYLDKLINEATEYFTSRENYNDILVFFLSA